MNNQMNQKKAGVVFIALLTFALAGQALPQGPQIEFKSNADDLTKIRSVLEEFRQDYSQGRVCPNEARAEPRCALSSHQQPGRS